MDELAKSHQQFNNGLNHLLEVQAGLADKQARNDEAIAHLIEIQAHLMEIQTQTLQGQAEVGQTQVKNELMMSQVLEALAQDAENIRALAGIARSHDKRLNQLEKPRE